MSETATIPAPRYVDYVDPDVLAALPPSFPCAWVAEESCRRVSEAVSDMGPEAGERLLMRATAFAEEVLSVLRADVLPEDLEAALFIDPNDRLQLIGRGSLEGQGARCKIRVDEDFRIVLIRERSIALTGPRAGTLRQEAREVLCFPLASADKKPVMAIQALDLAPVGEPGMFFLELDAPAGTGYIAGRCDRLRAYGDGKVLILSFRPMPNIDDQGYQVGNPDADLAALPGSAGRRLEEIAAGGPGKLEARNKARALAAARNAADEANEGLEAESGSGAGGASSGNPEQAASGASGESKDSRGAGAGGAGSDSPFDQPGWAASVAPVLK